MFEYNLYPTKEQERLLNEAFEEYFTRLITILVISPDRFVRQKCSGTPCGRQAPDGLTTSLFRREEGSN